MTTEEARKGIEQLSDREANVIASGLIADAINRLAAAQERQAEIQEKQWALASGMMDKMGPMVDKTMEMMDDRDDADTWKNGKKDEDEFNG